MAEDWAARLTQQLNPPSSSFTPEEWDTLCDGLRALTVDCAGASTLPLGVFRLVINRWAAENGREWKPTNPKLRAMLHQAGYDVVNVNGYSETGKRLYRRYVRGLQLVR
ncbi:hypothetical protein [Streptomyces sp. enrichment culture]|uniref:hypothetical protein n=1 Tax=Streptomyces sp. enrichment culture TaxID=1795815 RepID=UPI003F57EA0A